MDPERTNNAEHGSEYKIKEPIGEIAKRSYAAGLLRSRYNACAEGVLLESWNRTAKITTATKLCSINTK